MNHLYYDYHDHYDWYDYYDYKRILFGISRNKAVNRLKNSVSEDKGVL